MPWSAGAAEGRTEKGGVVRQNEKKKRRKLGKAEEKGTKRQSGAIKTGSFSKELSGGKYKFQKHPSGHCGEHTRKEARKRPPGR